MAMEACSCAQLVPAHGGAAGELGQLSVPPRLPPPFRQPARQTAVAAPAGLGPPAGEVLLPRSAGPPGVRPFPGRVVFVGIPSRFAGRSIPARGGPTPCSTQRSAASRSSSFRCRRARDCSRSARPLAPRELCFQLLPLVGQLFGSPQKTPPPANQMGSQLPMLREGPPGTLGLLAPRREGGGAIAQRLLDQTRWPKPPRDASGSLPPRLWPRPHGIACPARLLRRCRGDGRGFRRASLVRPIDPHPAADHFLRHAFGRPVAGGSTLGTRVF